MKHNKKLLAACAASACSLAVMAEGTTPTMDTTAAETMITTAQTGLTTFMTNITPTITSIVLTGLAIWAAFVVIRLVKKAFSRAG